MTAATMTSATQDQTDLLGPATPDAVLGADSARSVLARAFSLLEAFTSERPVLSLGELAAFAALPKSTTHRIAASLVDCGALQRHGSLGYSVGAWLHDVGMLSPARARLLAASTPFIHELHEQTRATAHLGVLSPMGPLYLDKVGGNSSPALFTRPGSTFPTHSTALGKCLLAMTPDATADVANTSALRRFTQRTLVTPQQLTMELSRIREEHLGHDREETLDGISCIGAPVLNHSGLCVAAISVCTPTGRLNERRTAQLVQRAASNIERALGREVIPASSVRWPDHQAKPAIDAFR